MFAYVALPQNLKDLKAVDLHDLEGDASPNKRAKRDEKHTPKQKQAKLPFASLANDAAKPQQ